MKSRTTKPSWITGERTCALALAATGIFVLVRGLEYPIVRDEGIVGPGLMPLLAGAALGALSLAILLKDITGGKDPHPRHQNTETLVDQVQAAEIEESGSPKRVAVVLGLLVAGIIATPVIGLLVAFTMVVFVLVFFVEHQRFITAAATSLGLSLGAWLVFVRLLEVPLPAGSLFE